MNRRDFLASLLATGVAATFDIDKLLWIPNERKIFIPSPRMIAIDLETLWHGPVKGKYGWWLADNYLNSEEVYIQALLREIK